MFSNSEALSIINTDGLFLSLLKILDIFSVGSSMKKTSFLLQYKRKPNCISSVDLPSPPAPVINSILSLVRVAITFCKISLLNVCFSIKSHLAGAPL